MFRRVVVFCVLFALEIVKCEDVSGKDYFQMPPVFHLDDYDKCMQIEDQRFYCNVKIHLSPNDAKNISRTWEIIQRVNSHPKNYRHDFLRYGVCIPESCPNIWKKFKTKGEKKWTNLDMHLSDCFSEKFQESGLKAEVNVDYCLSPDNKRPIGYLDVTVAIFFISYFLFIFCASLYEGTARYKTKEEYNRIVDSRIGGILASFSIPKNWYRLTKIDPQLDDGLQPMQSVKFFNMCCVILCHTVMVSLAGPIMNTQYVENMTQTTLNMFIANGGYAVQTFFLISGWLMSYHFFIYMDRKKKFEWKLILISFVNRYVRLTPLLLVMIAFHCTWLVHWSDGPVWDHIVGTEYNYCRENWWTNLLYINNYVGKENMCMQQTWYIAADTQLFIVSLFVLTFAWTLRRATKVILASAVIIGVALPGIISYYYKTDILLRQFAEPLYLYLLKSDLWHMLYSSAESNFGGYALGLFFGYIYYENRNKKFTINKFQYTLWWIFTYGMCIGIILVAGLMYKEGFTYSRLGAAAYWAFGKNLFALGIAFGLYGVSLHIGWFMNSLLRWKNTQILGRLTYSAYIVHVALVKYRGGIARQPLYISNYYLFYSCLSDISLSFVYGLLMCLAFEMPISALQKLFVPQLASNNAKILPNNNPMKSKREQNAALILQKSTS